MLPLMVAVFFASTFGAKFYKHKKKVTIIGLLVTISSAFILKNQITEVASLNSIAYGLIVLGIGIGLIMSQLTNITISSVSIKRAGEASGLNSTIRRFGAALGTAIMGTIMFTLLSNHFAINIRKNVKIQPALQKVLIQNVRAKQTITDIDISNINKAQQINIKKSYSQAFITATKQTLYIMILFLIPALLAAVLLPNDKILNQEQQ